MPEITYYMNIHAQNFEHDDACINATKEALEALRDGIDNILKNDKLEGVIQFFASDGEGYDLRIFIKQNPEEASHYTQGYNNGTV